MKHIHYKLH